MNARRNGIRWRRLALGGSLLAMVVVFGLLASNPALGGRSRRLPSISVGAFRSHAPGSRSPSPKPYDSCSQNCSFPEGNITLTVNLTDSPCDGSYSFDVDPGDKSGLITNVLITGTCDTSQNPSEFTGSGSTTHLYADESTGALTVTFYVHDPDVGVVPGTLSLTLTEGDSLVGHGANFTFKPGVQFTQQLATFTDTPSNGYTAPASDMFPTVDWNDGSPPGSPLDGTVSVSGNGGTFTITGTHTYAGPGPYLVTIKLEDDQPGTAVNQAFDKASVRAFTASPLANVDAGTSINYQGSGFNASGSQIAVGWDDLVDPVQTTTFAPATTFSGKQVAVFGHPTANSNVACHAKLTATQDGATDTLDVTGTQDQVVLADRFVDRLPSQTPLQTPDYLCHGEQFSASQPPDILTYVLRDGIVPPSNAESFVFAQDFVGSGATDKLVPIGGYVANGQARVHGEIFLARGATLCLPLTSTGGSATRGSMTMPASSQGQFQAGLIGPKCLSTAPNGTGIKVVDSSQCASSAQIGPGTVRGPITVNGFTCSKGSLTVDGDVDITGGVLMVQGNLIVRGSVNGTGALFSDGATAIRGHSLTTFSTNNFVEFESGGDIYLLNL